MDMIGAKGPPGRQGRAGGRDGGDPQGDWPVKDSLIFAAAHLFRLGGLPRRTFPQVEREELSARLEAGKKPCPGF